MIVYVNYDWINQPAMTLKDCFGLAWDNTIFEAVPGSYMQTTYWQVRSLFNTWVEQESDYALAYTSDHGAGWNTDIKYAYGLDYVIDNYGFGRITLKVKNPSQTGTSQFNLNYSHAITLGLGVGLTFGPVSVSYSGSSDAYTRGDYYNVTY